ncbi:MAG TPA: hypothetical protein VGM50_13660 [Gemmatimonadaceae bacterium]|jgi:hypothetical protein
MGDFSWPQAVFNAATSIVSFYVGVRTAHYQFDLSRQRAEKQAALALRADLERLDANLGREANAFGATVRGMTFETPRFHRWSEPIIAQLAAADARIVAECMELDRNLANFSAAVIYFRKAHGHHDDMRVRVQAYKNAPLDENAGLSAHAQRAAEEETAKDSERDAREIVATAVQEMKDHHAVARSTIGRLLRYTSAVADEPDRPFMQLPDERRQLVD